MRNLSIIFLILLNFLLSMNLKAQVTIGPDTAALKMYVRKYSDNSPQISEYLYNNNPMIIGNDGSLMKYRAFYQWNIPDNIIPNNAQIDTVELFFTYHPNGANCYISVEYSNIGVDLENPDALTMWNRSERGSLYKIGSGQGNKYGYQGSQTDTVISRFGPFSNFCNALENALPEDKFILGITSNSERYSYEWFINNLSLTMRIVFSQLAQNITVDQKLSNDSNVDSVGLWNYSENKFENFLAPGNFSWLTNSSKTLRGSQKLLSNQKYIHWEENYRADNNIANHKTFEIIPTTSNLTSRFNPTYQGITVINSLEGTQIDPVTDSIKFADPWYIDYEDPDYADSVRNRAMKDTGPDALQYRSRTSPFYPDYTTVYQNDNDPSHAYQGVFLDQDFNIPGQPYYYVQAISPQPITLDEPVGTRNFYFQNWDGSNVSFQNSSSDLTGIVFHSGDAVATAVLKGRGLSDDGDGFSSNGQRKIVKTDDGYLHYVYRSMGRIWYEISSDGGTTWNLLNGGVSLTDGQFVDFIGTPSIDYFGIYTVVAYQTIQDGIVLKFFKGGGNPYTYSLYGTLQDDNVTTDQECFPVIAINGQTGGTPASFMVVWQVSDSHLMTPGLYCKFGRFRSTTPSDFYWVTDSQLINNASITTNSSSGYPTLTNKKIHNSNSSFNLAWQQGYNDINYCTLRVNGTNTVFESPAVISETDGFTYNMFPSISMADGDNLIFSWVGHNGSGIEKKTGKENGGISSREETKIVVKRGIPGNFFNSGSHVHYVNNNSTSSGGENSVIIWSEGNPAVSKWVLRTGTSYGSTQTLGKSGIQNQVSNGYDLSAIKAMVYNTSVTPYFFTQASEDFSDGVNGIPGTGKISSNINLTYGKSGIVNKGGVQFLFNIGDIVLADTTVQFISRPDTILYTNTDELNEVMRSLTFHLDNQSQLYFTNFYYTVNQELADSVLTEDDFVTFKAELVNANTNSVAGKFDEITYSKNNLDEYDNINYQVDCSGIDEGDYYLRLVTVVSGDASYNLANVQNDDPGLEKRDYHNVGFDGSTAPIIYDLSQNYPNPFNPTTTINYQMPQNGFVTLKIYDILGKEVATLVNEQKNQGRYSVKFDGSKLSSGVYIYQIHVKDYVSSRKMLLIK